MKVRDVSFFNTFCTFDSLCPGRRGIVKTTGFEVFIVFVESKDLNGVTYDQNTKEYKLTIRETEVRGGT